ncbi:hypothetical protein Y032_0040g183 [Ancylostoma ceylanicum]|uniref:Uncharacterized protein n=1 Tax=Ancylostoma ceylanicum TaxID=53326 RepID=A0A016UHP3_9BILA|nr:hypothetical protein Y032_0040g183 [Ancylostoma ceylanicum]
METFWMTGRLQQSPKHSQATLTSNTTPTTISNAPIGQETSEITAMEEYRRSETRLVTDGQDMMDRTA